MKIIETNNTQFKSVLPLATLFLFFISSTITWGSTTILSYELFSYIRISAVILFFASFFLVIATDPKIKSSTFYSLSILLCLLGSIFINALIYGTLSDNFGNIIFNYFIILALTYLISIYDHNHSYAFSLMIIVYGMLVLSVTIFSGGIELRPLPYFAMEYISKQENVNYTINYSQGITKIFGLCAIAAFYNFSISRSISMSLVFSFIAIFFILLSAIGGARGDFVAVLAVIFIIMFKSRNLLLWTLILIVTVSSILLMSNQLDIQELALIERFSRIESSGSYRLSIFKDALTLLYQSPNCLVFGCGFNYFQSYFNYPADLHPHNIFIEYIIVFGIIVSIVSLALFFIGLYNSRREGGDLGVLTPVLIFFLLIGLKSGTLVSSWFAMAYIFYFMGLGLRLNKA